MLCIVLLHLIDTGCFVFFHLIFHSVDHGGAKREQMQQFPELNQGWSGDRRCGDGDPGNGDRSFGPGHRLRKRAGYHSNRTLRAPTDRH